MQDIILKPHVKTGHNLKIYLETNNNVKRAVVVAQLVEQSLPIPEARGSNPVIGNIYVEHLFTCLLSTVLKRRK